MELTPTEVDGLLGAWALDGLDPADAALVDAAIAADPDLARRAAELRGAVAAIGETISTEPPTDVRSALLGAAARRPPALAEPTDPVTLFANQVAGLADVLEVIDDAGWGRPARPYAWTVHGLIAHLLVIERYTAGQLGLRPARTGGPTHHLQMGTDEIAVESGRAPTDTARDWHETAAATIDALHDGTGPDLDVSVEFHEWPLTVGSLLIARSFEVWTHADDVRRAMDDPVVPPPAGDLRTMSQFSVNSLPLVLPLVADAAQFGGARIVLTGDGGGTFDLGDPARRDAVVVTDVVDYCRLAARRIATDDLDVEIEGDRTTADDLLAAAQVFAV